MFWTALIWGLGVSIGGAVGMMLFVILFAIFKCVTGRAKKEAELWGFNEKSLALLDERNELTKIQIEAIVNLAARGNDQ